MTIERILGTDTGKEAFGKTDRNFVALETALNNVSGAASDITYDNSASQMTATDVQAAVDELKVQNNSLETQLGTIETQTITANYNAINSIPTTAKRGKLDAKYKGMSTVNVIKNGSFKDASEWFSNGPTGTIAIASNVLKHTISSIQAYAGIQQTVKPVEGHKYYLKYDIKPFRTHTPMIYAFGTNYSMSQVATNGVFNSVSCVIPSAGSFSSLVFYDNGASDTGMAVGSETSYKNVRLVDLTALDLAVKTELECNNIFANYFDGLQGSTGIKAVSCGKNLLDLSKQSFGGENTVSSLKDNELTIRGRWYSAFIVSVKPNTNYTIKHTHISGYNLLNVYDVDITTGIGAANSTFNTGNRDKIAILIYSGTGTEGTSVYKDIQLEEGTVATTYEPYKATVVEYKTLDGKAITLHRLPNGVYDEITEDGKYIKRIAEKTLIASDIAGVDTSPANIDVVTITRPADSLGYNTIMEYVGNWYNTNESTPLNGAGVDNASSAWKHYSAPTVLALIVPIGTYANLAAAQTALVGTKLIYQLATPQILDTNATPLIAEPNGQVSVIPTSSPQPSAEFSYPINLGAVVDGLIEGQKQHSELLINQNAINLDFDLRITALEP